MTGNTSCSRSTTRLTGLIPLLLAASLAGCADLRQHTQQATLTANSADAHRLVLAKELRLSLPAGFDVTRVPANTLLNPVGNIEQGTVLRPAQVVVQLSDCSNEHEAYLVSASGQIVGLYLPVEELFLKASTPTTAVFKENP